MRQRRGRGQAAGTGAFSTTVTGTELVPRGKVSAVPLTDAGPILSLCSFLKGGRKQFMELARLASQIEPELQVVVDDYDSLSSAGQNGIDVDALCSKHEINPAHFLGVVAEAAVKFRNNASLIVAAMSFPSVVQASVKFAMKEAGHRDRKYLMEHAGFVPTNAGTRIQLNQNNSNTGVQNLAASPGMPAFETTMRRVDDAIRD